MKTKLPIMVSLALIIAAVVYAAEVPALKPTPVPGPAASQRYQLIQVAYEGSHKGSVVQFKELMRLDTWTGKTWLYLSNPEAKKIGWFAVDEFAKPAEDQPADRDVLPREGMSAPIGQRDR